MANPDRPRRRRPSKVVRHGIVGFGAAASVSCEHRPSLSRDPPALPLRYGATTVPVRSCSSSCWLRQPLGCLDVVARSSAVFVCCKATSAASSIGQRARCFARATSGTQHRRRPQAPPPCPTGKRRRCTRAQTRDQHWVAGRRRGLRGRHAPRFLTTGSSRTLAETRQKRGRNAAETRQNSGKSVAG